VYTLVKEDVQTATDKPTYAVNSVLKLIGVSTSGYYKWLKRLPSAQQIKKDAAKVQITKIYHESHQIYGAPKIASILQANGMQLTEKTVGNYMRELGIRAIWTSPYRKTTIDPNFDDQLKNILNREFNPIAPNTVWVTDITYIHTLAGFVYLTSIMDLFSRKIIGWHVANSLNTEHVVEAIEKAKQQRQLEHPILIHSDRGCQFVSEQFLKTTPAHQFIHSYSRKSTPWDNACIESFHALIKREWLNRYVIKNLEHAHQLIFNYIEAFYNTIRIHSHCAMQSPYDYECKFDNLENQ
jgi:putative transposase